MPNGPQMETKSENKSETLRKLRDPKKLVKTKRQTVCKSFTTRQNRVLAGVGAGPLFFENQSISKILQNASPGCPGLEKAAQRHPKCVQQDPMKSKRRSQGIRIR